MDEIRQYRRAVIVAGRGLMRLEDNLITHRCQSGIGQAETPRAFTRTGPYPRRIARDLAAPLEDSKLVAATERGPGLLSHDGQRCPPGFESETEMLEVPVDHLGHLWRKTPLAPMVKLLPLPTEIGKRLTIPELRATPPPARQDLEQPSRREDGTARPIS